MKTVNKNRMANYTYLFACLGFFSVIDAFAGNKSFMVAEGPTKLLSQEEIDANEGLQQTIKLNFSPENREKLRRALDEYARSVDQNHDQVEESRRAMKESIERRFLDADKDGDGSVDRIEATESLPQVARLFSQVDTNRDGVVTLDELEEVQAKIIERRRQADLAIQEKKLQAAVDAIAGKAKENQTVLNTKKSRVN